MDFMGSLNSVFEVDVVLRYKYTRILPVFESNFPRLFPKIRLITIKILHVCMHFFQISLKIV